MTLLPIFLKLEGRPALLVGAGTVALEKIGTLLKTGVKLRVVAPQARPEIRQLAAEGKLEWIEREFRALRSRRQLHRHRRHRCARSQCRGLSRGCRARHPLQQRRRHSQLRLLLRLGREPRRSADRDLDGRRKPRRRAAPAPRDRRAIAQRPRPLARPARRSCAAKFSPRIPAAKSAGCSCTNCAAATKSAIRLSAPRANWRGPAKGTGARSVAGHVASGRRRARRSRLAHRQSAAPHRKRRCAAARRSCPAGNPLPWLRPSRNGSTWASAAARRPSRRKRSTR